MQLTLTGKQIDVGDTLRRHIEGSLSSILGKYFGSAIEAHVVVSREAHLSRAEISVRIGRGIVVNAHAAASELYAAFDASLVLSELMAATTLLDEEVVSASSGKKIHRLLAKKSG